MSALSLKGMEKEKKKKNSGGKKNQAFLGKIKL